MCINLQNLYASVLDINEMLLYSIWTIYEMSGKKIASIYFPPVLRQIVQIARMEWEKWKWK